MINVINYYYGMNIINIYEINEKYFFDYDETRYSFIKYDRDKKDINSIINICNELKKRNIMTNEIVLNRFNNYFSSFNKAIYILIRENARNYSVSFNDILYIQNNTTNLMLDPNIIQKNWVDLWKNKINFYEGKIPFFNNKHKLINDTIDYYIGFGETAIAYLVNNNINVKRIVLSHRRLDNEFDSFDFYNPLNYILDNRVRDIADYIKSLFFYGEISEEVLFSLFKYIMFSREEYILFFSRLLFPTYYFDLLDKILFDNDDECILKNVLEKDENYKIFLKKLFYYINYNLKMNLPVIDWIIKT